MIALPGPPRPYPYLRVGYLHATRLFDGIGQAVDIDVANIAIELGRGLDAVAVGATTGEGRVPADVVDVLTACEVEGVPTVLIAEATEQLETATAAVVSHVVTEVEAVHAEAVRRFGPDQVLLLPTAVTFTQEMSDPLTTAEESRNRNRLLAEGSIRARADALMRLLGLMPDPVPLITVILVTRKAQHLNVGLGNLQRQVHPYVDPIVVVDPLFADDAADALKNTGGSVRLVVAEARSTVASRLNIGVAHARGSMIAIFEESAIYGPRYLSEQLLALQSSGAALVGKASWLVWDESTQAVRVRAPELQWTFDHVPALGTLVLYRDVADSSGFSRRATAPHRSLVERLLDAGGRVWSAHALDVILLRRGQRIEDVAREVLEAGVFAADR